MTEPLVCICVPNYNNEKTISATLDSLLNQTYKNIIIKVFDNASTDNSMEILRDYEKKYDNIKVFQNKENIGGEANFTKCIQNMEGKYGAVFHSDDVYLPTMVQEQVSVLENNDIGLVFTNAYYINEKSKIVGSSYLPNEIKRYDYIELELIQLIKLILKYGNFLICPSAMGHVDIYKNHISIWNGKDYKTSADLDVWIRFARYKNIGIINKELMKYRLSDNSYSYRVKKIRTIPSDFFLVMDNVLSSDVAKYLNTNDIENYNFLQFKDRVLININNLRKNKQFTKYNIPFKISFLKFCLRKRACKFIFTGLVLKLLKLLNYRKKGSN